MPGPGWRCLTGTDRQRRRGPAAWTAPRARCQPSGSRKCSSRGSSGRRSSGRRSGGGSRRGRSSRRSGGSRGSSRRSGGSRGSSNSSSSSVCGAGFRSGVCRGRRCGGAGSRRRGGRGVDDSDVLSRKDALEAAVSLEVPPEPRLRSTPHNHNVTDFKRQLSGTDISAEIVLC